MLQQVMSTTKPRFDEIDLLRGLSCLAVVAFHYLWRGHLGHWVTEKAPVWLALPSSFGHLGVHLFFMISGFVIFMSAQGASVRAFAASRAARLYPAIWIAAPLTAAVAWWAASPDFQVDLKTLLVNLTLLPHHFKFEFVDGAYWSLAVEIQFYLLMTVVVWRRSLDRIELLLMVWLGLSIVNVMRPVHLLQVWLIVQWAPLFAGGIVAFRVRSLGLTRERVWLYLSAWLLSVIYMMKFKHPELSVLSLAGMRAVDASLITLFFVLFALIGMGRLSMKPNFWTRWAGLLTYPVYLLHQNIGYIGIEWLRGQGVGLLAAATMMLVLVVAVSVLIALLVEKPLGRWLRRVLQGPRQQTANVSAGTPA